MNVSSRWISGVVALCLFITLSSYDLPDEKVFVSRKIAKVSVRDANGNTVPLLGNSLNKPVILSPVYTRCPSACTLISGGLKTTVKKLGTLGKDFTIISFSFDFRDTPEELYMYEGRWGMDGKNWKTVNADSATTIRLLESVDYDYEFNETTQEYNHPNVVVVLTPSGRISRYIYGIEPKAKDLKLAIMEAQLEKTSINNFMQSLYVRCFSFDPATKSYHLDWRFIIQTSAGLMMMFLMGFFLIRSLYFSKYEDEE